MIKHPLYDWLAELKTVNHREIVAWTSPADEEEERAPVDLGSIDEIRVRRALLRPSRTDLRYVARKLKDPEVLPGWELDGRPPIREFRKAWLEPQSASLRGIRLRLPPKKTLLAVRFSSAYSPGFDQHWGYACLSLFKDRAVLFKWNDVMYEQFTPEWLMMRPVGLIQAGNPIPSMCLLLQSRAAQKGACNMFEEEEPNFGGARTTAGRIAPIDLYRILLADSGVRRAVLMDLEDQRLMTYRTKKMGWGFRELENLYSG